MDINIYRELGPEAFISWQLSVELKEKLLRPIAEGRIAAEAHDIICSTSTSVRTPRAGGKNGVLF